MNGLLNHSLLQSWFFTWKQPHSFVYHNKWLWDWDMRIAKKSRFWTSGHFGPSYGNARVLKIIMVQTLVSQKHGNAYVRITLCRISILNFRAKISTGLCRALLCGDDSSPTQSQSGKGLSWPPEGIPYWRYHGASIDPTYQSHTLDPTPDLPFPISQVTIRLLIKDFEAVI